MALYICVYYYYYYYYYYSVNGGKGVSVYKQGSKLWLVKEVWFAIDNWYKLTTSSRPGSEDERHADCCRAVRLWCWLEWCSCFSVQMCSSSYCCSSVMSKLFWSYFEKFYNAGNSDLLQGMPECLLLLTRVWYNLKSEFKCVFYVLF